MNNHKFIIHHVNKNKSPKSGKVIKKLKEFDCLFFDIKFFDIGRDSVYLKLYIYLCFIKLIIK